MKLPNRIKLSLHATERLKLLKGFTGVTPNILARVAIMLVVRDSTSLENSGLQDTDGQELSKDVLFGEHSDIYEVYLRQYIGENNKTDESIQKTIAKMIEVGVHKIGHARSVGELVVLS